MRDEILGSGRLDLQVSVGPHAHRLQVLDEGVSGERDFPRRRDVCAHRGARRALPPNPTPCTQVRGALRATFRVGQVSVAAPDLKSPILVLANPADHVVDYRATRAFLRPAHADFIDVVRLPRSC